MQVTFRGPSNTLGSRIMIMIFSIICILVGFFIQNQMKGNYIKTEAVITEITLDRIGVNDDEHDVYVDYTVNGKSYEHVLLPSYSITMNEGKTITIEYNETDPYNIRTPGTVFIPYVLWLFGVAGVAWSGYMFVKPLLGGKENEEE